MLSSRFRVFKKARELFSCSQSLVLWERRLQHIRSLRIFCERTRSLHSRAFDILRERYAVRCKNQLHLRTVFQGAQEWDQAIFFLAWILQLRQRRFQQLSSRTICFSVLHQWRIKLLLNRHESRQTLCRWFQWRLGARKKRFSQRIMAESMHRWKLQFLLARSSRPSRCLISCCIKWRAVVEERRLKRIHAFSQWKAGRRGKAEIKCFLAWKSLWRLKRTYKFVPSQALRRNFHLWYSKSIERHHICTHQTRFFSQWKSKRFEKKCDKSLVGRVLSLWITQMIKRVCLRLRHRL